jgi:transcription elongation factor Elf1
VNIGTRLKCWRCPKCKQLGHGRIIALDASSMSYEVSCKLCGKAEFVADHIAPTLE